MIAGYNLRLRSILGRKTGHDQKFTQTAEKIQHASTRSKAGKTKFRGFGGQR